jgi:hypothetical protein
MSQNGPYSGPPWSGGSSDEPYAEASDPWGDAGSGAEPAWGANPPSIPQQPVSYHSAPISAPVSGSAMWGQPPLPPKRNTGIVSLVVVLGLLIVVGLGTTAWLLKQQNDRDGRQAKTTTSTAPSDGSVQGSEDARFVTEGQCVTNDGSNDDPAMHKTACTTGTYQVLKVFHGKTTGEKDAENKCSKVAGYTNWYFYDSEFDDLDFVLCLKRR